jgi:hypothetical protein
VQGEHKRHVVLAALVATASVCLAATALASHTMQPGYEPAQLDPTTRAHGGNPPPDEVRWNSPNSCDKKRFKGRTGTRRLYAFIEYWWPRVEFWGYGSEPCRESLHDEGRAVDVHLNLRVKKDRKAARQIKRFFLRKDSHGERWAMARRFGIQELIWNCHIWTSTYASEGWRRYSRCGPGASYTLKHKDHVHIGQQWRGARKKTTAYTGYTWCHQCADPEGTAARDGLFDSLPSPAPDGSGNPVATAR